MKAAGDQLELVSALLDISRLEAGRSPIERQEVQLQPLLDELISGTRELSKAKPLLHIMCQATPELHSLYTDRTKLKIVLKNLLSNAVKFTESGNITVTVTLEENGVAFCVADTGIGIAPEILPIIFDMFRQGDSSDTRRHTGVGLGLYIAQRIAEMLGGTITVNSQVGQGSVFRVWLPNG